jgi:predicted PurR-regulated permease PerM
MSEVVPRHRVSVLFTLAAFVVVVAGMRAASSLMVPFMLSVFIAVISFPALDWMHERGVPQWLALLLVILAVFLAGLGLSAIIGTSVGEFSRQLPEYEQTLRAQARSLLAWLDGLGIHLPREGILSALDPSAAMGLASRLLSGLNNTLSNAFLILLTVSFILLEAWNIPDKLRVALPAQHDSLEYMKSLSVRVRQYIGIKSAVSLATGVLIGAWLLIIDLDFALLWALLAFLLNFVPTVGSILAGVPAVLLALVQGGPGLAGLTLLGFAVANFVIGNVIEPRVMGRGLGLSPLVVFLSLVFWGWVFGPVGMLLSVPLTMVTKVALELGENTRWLAVLMGPNPGPPAPSEADQQPGERA